MHSELVQIVNTSFTLIDILIFVLMELPLHIAAGYLLGVGVARNECFKTNLSFWKIVQTPLILRSTAMISYWLADWVYPWWVVFITYPLVFFTAVGIIIYRNKSLPESFVPLASEEDADRANQECGERCRVVGSYLKKYKLRFISLRDLNIQSEFYCMLRPKIEVKSRCLQNLLIFIVVLLSPDLIAGLISILALFTPSQIEVRILLPKIIKQVL
jgi:hypothetical protein